MGRDEEEAAPVMFHWLHLEQSRKNYLFSHNSLFSLAPHTIIVIFIGSRRSWMNAPGLAVRLWPALSPRRHKPRVIVIPHLTSRREWTGNVYSFLIFLWFPFRFIHEKRAKRFEGYLWSVGDSHKNEIPSHQRKPEWPEPRRVRMGIWYSSTTARATLF